MAQENLPDAELELLACLHRLGGEATARRLREEMADFRPLTHSSVVTLLGRLETRGLVNKAKGPVGKAFVYRPVKDAGTTFRPVLRKLLRRIFGGDGVAMMASIFETKPPTTIELDKMEELLEQLRRQTGKKGKHK
jgi:BlaI family transcriptional regulator, penicillinase repressor